MATINPKGFPAQGQPMTPSSNIGTTPPLGAPATPGLVLPGANLQPVAATPPSWNDSIRIMRAILDLWEREGTTTANDLIAWINSRK